MTAPHQDIHAHRILILDFGSQYTQLIARRVRELGVYCEIHPWDAGDDESAPSTPSGIILSGGPESVLQPNAPFAPKAVFELGVPVLGICYGMQTMAAQLGGKVEPGAVHEFGYAEIRARGHSTLLRDIEDRVNDEGHGLLDVWMSHGDHVTALPPGFKVIASTSDVPMAGMADETRKLYALQFHPEVTHTKQGARIYARFLHEICGCGESWNAGNIIEDAIARVRAQVGKGRVLLGLSGGVDSSVVAALLHKAIGDQLTCVFVDHGLLRLHEGDEVMRVFAKNLGVKVIRVNAADRYFRELKGVRDPEAKRKVIGRLFIEIFDEEAAKLTDVAFLAQGTIYPDVIESAGSKTGKAHVIKSHHNVGGLPAHMKLKLVEPLRELFKDEVRKHRAGAGAAGGDGAPASVPGAGTGRADPGRSDAGGCRYAAAGGSHLHRGAAEERVVREDQPGVCGVPAGEERRRHRRRAASRAGDRAAGRRDDRFHDGALGAPAV